MTLEISLIILKINRLMVWTQTNEIFFSHLILADDIVLFVSSTEDLNNMIAEFNVRHFGNFVCSAKADIKVGNEQRSMFIIYEI